MAKPTQDAPPTAARAQEILEAPERARRLAEQAASAEHRVEAQRTLGQSLEKRLATVRLIRLDLEQCHARRPTVTPAELEEGLGPRHVEAIDQVVMVGRRLLERVTVGEAEAQRLGAALEHLLDAAALGSVIQAVAQLEVQEPGLKAAHQGWRALRAAVATKSRASAAIGSAQAAWLALEEAP